jgi:hypothetical protein
MKYEINMKHEINSIHADAPWKNPHQDKIHGLQK